MSITIFTGSIFIITGTIMLLFPPKTINSVYGYRTKNSMKSQERWDFSQKYSSIEMMKLGGGLLCVSLITNFIDFGKYSEFVGLAFMLVGLIVFLIRTEKAIKNKFSES